MGRRPSCRGDNGRPTARHASLFIASILVMLTGRDVPDGAGPRSATQASKPSLTNRRDDAFIAWTASGAISAIRVAISMARVLELVETL